MTRASIRRVALVTLVLAAAGCRRTEVTPTPEPPAPSGSAGAARRPSPTASRVELDEARFEGLKTRFPYHRLLRAPAFAVSWPASSPSPRPEEIAATAVFGAVPDPKIGAFTAPVLGVVADTGSAAPELVELLHFDTGNLVGVDALEVRSAEGSADDGFHSAPTPAGPGEEILLVASFTAQDSTARFRRGFHLIWTPSGHLVQSLGSYALRDVATIANLDDLRRALADPGVERDCPDLAYDMESETLALSLQCMIARDRREQLARSVLYPIDVLPSNGVVRTIESAAQLVAAYDDLVHRGAREGVRQAAANPDSHHAWASYDGYRLGYAGLIVDPRYGTFEGKHLPPQITTILNDDPAAHEQMNAKLKDENRALWQGTKGDVVCRSQVATHVLSPWNHGTIRLATWYDPRADIRKRAPARVLFGVLARAGTGGNQFYEFVGPRGKMVEFEHITLYGPGPAFEYQVRSSSVDEPCLNHEAYKGY